MRKHILRLVKFMIDLSLTLSKCLLADDCAIYISKAVDPTHKAQVGRIHSDNKTISINGQMRIQLAHPITDLSPYEIWLVFAETKRVLRFFRSESNSNTILLTERCDQKCLMCSQPPRNLDYAHFELYKQAIALIPDECVIGISGGEPTLFKRELFEFFDQVISNNKKIKFHVLTNGQHFVSSDIKFLIKFNKSVIWAVPIYSNEEKNHDQIVGKIGAYVKLLEGLSILAKSSSQVELRTVILRENIFNLSLLANFIGTNLPWVRSWSIMQLEKKGYARLDWQNKFYDTSSDFSMVERALEICRIKKIHTDLFNFPRCTTPVIHRNLCRKSISDWKQKYLENCDNCNEKNLCCGFFEWYDEADGFKNILVLS